jgi:quinol monooxygenase YgiN
MPLSIIATLSVAEGKNTEFEQVAAQMAALVNEKEPRCNFYQFNKSREDAQTYIAIEQYVDQEAFDTHCKTDYFRELGKQLSALMSAAPEIQFLDTI